MTHRPLIVLSLEGLATSALSCYGSSWNRTPAIDAIASTGCVWDRWTAHVDDPTTVLRETIKSTTKNWADAWRAHGSVELLTDVASTMDGLQQSCFDRLCTLADRHPTESQLPVEEIADSQFGQLVAAAIERDSQPEPWGVLWLHSGFLTRCWDAPRDLFPIDDEDGDSGEPTEEVDLLEVGGATDEHFEQLPPIFDTVIPPKIGLEGQTHPDLVTSWMRTYGCQVRLLDLLIDVLVTSLQVRDPYVVLMGASGFRLGQGGWIGHRQGPLRSMDLRLPMIASHHGPIRVPHLTGINVLPDVLRDLGQQQGPLISADRWSESSIDERVETRTDRAQCAVTTPGWFCVRDVDSSEHLFLKPDDVDDFNDVGRIRDDVVQQLIEPKK